MEEVRFKDKLLEQKQYIDKNGEDPPEIRNWGAKD
jgi:phosphoketolase